MSLLLILLLLLLLLPQVSLQPLVDALCTSTCGGNTDLADKLRSEEAKEVITNLSRAKEELKRREAIERKLAVKMERLDIESKVLRAKVAEQQAVIESLLAEVDSYKKKRGWKK